MTDTLEKLQWGFFWFWVKRFRISFLLVFLIILVGIFSMLTIPKESSPDIKFGIISISTVYPWVSPVDMDSLITQEIEKEIKDIEWIKKISSSSGVGVSSTTVELETWANIATVLADIKDTVDAINLPEDAEDPLVREISTDNSLMFQLVLYWDKDIFNNFELTQKAKRIESALEWKGQIASIDVEWWNAGDYEITVAISKSKLESLGLNLAQISSTIRQYNKNTPIWSYTIGDLSYDFRIEWELKSLEELGNVIIRDSGTSQITINDIATISREYKTNTLKELWLYNKTGFNYITLNVNKASGESIFGASKSAKQEIEAYLSGKVAFAWLEYLYIRDASETIKDDYRNLWNTAIQTLVLVFITILLFVGLRESIIASLILPLSFLMTFTVLYSFGFSLNFLTNFSLVLTLWIAIDTIIVIIEWWSERYKLWYNRLAAILIAVRDLKWPLISWTMTTLVAFLPMMFLPGITGKFLAYIPITVFATLIAALFLSLTVSSALFIKITGKSKFYHKEKSLEKSMWKDDRKLLEEQRVGKTEKTWEQKNLREKILGAFWEFFYKKLDFFIRRRSLRLLSIFIPFIILICTFLFLSPKIGFVLFPASDNSTINLEFTWPTWAKPESLEKYVSWINTKISKYEEVKLFYTSISWNNISTYIELTNSIQRQDEWKRTVFEIEELIVEELSYLESEWLRLEVQVEWWWPPWGKAVWISLTTNSTDDIAVLKSVADDFEEFVQGIEWTKNITISTSETPGQFTFSFDRKKLSNVGLSPNDILNELYFYTAWIKSWSIASEFEDNTIVLKIKEFDTELTPWDISNLMIQTQIWKVRVWDYLYPVFDKSLSSIKREDTKIIIKVEADVKSGTLPTDVQPKFLEYAQTYDYPEWITYIAWWENEDNAELIQSTMRSFVIALFLIFTILVLQFNSYSRPAIILYSVVLALIWVNIWLFVTGNPYSMPFAIWFIALTWVVVNDAIILLDRVVKNIERLEKNTMSPGKEDYIEAVVWACKTRLQPIIVTTLTTLFWVLPLALQDAFWAGLGYTIIFWLFAWSFMTLFVIPSLYFEIYLRKKK